MEKTLPSQCEQFLFDVIGFVDINPEIILNPAMEQ